MSDTWVVVLAALAGVVTGVLSGMFGIGGAIVSNPSIRALGAGPITAVGSTLPSISPSAIAGTLRYRREGLVLGRVVAYTGLSGVTASVGGSLLSAEVPGEGHVLTLGIAVLLGITALRLTLAPHIPTPVVAETDPEVAVARDVLGDAGPHTGRLRLVVIGVVSGAMSGLLGVGGGILMVPLFTGWLRLPLKHALATSLACVGVLAVPGAATHAALGHIDWLFALPLFVGVIPGARLGAHLTIRTEEHTLRMLVGIALSALALVYGATEIIALV